MSGTPNSASDLALDREKWLTDTCLREREIAIKEREQDIKDREVQARIEELKRSRWANQLVLAVLAATLAAGGNAAVAVINGILQRSAEETKAISDNQLEKSKYDAE